MSDKKVSAVWVGAFQRDGTKKRPKKRGRKGRERVVQNASGELSKGL